MVLIGEGIWECSRDIACDVMRWKFGRFSNPSFCSCSPWEAAAFGSGGCIPVINVRGQKDGYPGSRLQLAPASPSWCRYLGSNQMIKKSLPIFIFVSFTERTNY